MRLLNTYTSESKLTLEEFRGNKILLYAILSHV
jgi:ankyrin repeat protein